MNSNASFKLEQIISLLNPYCNSNLHFTKSSLKSLKVNELATFYDFISNPKKINKFDTIIRPVCPVKKPYCCSSARYPYKEGMGKYIAQWGYKFKNPLEITPTLLEATANYLEYIQKNTKY